MATLITKSDTSTVNTGFYDNIPLEMFKDIAQKSGFTQNPDIGLIYSMIKNSKIIAEIGLGYGRCVDALLEKGYTGQIYAVERVEKFAAMASEKYDKKQVTVFSDDVINVKFPQNVDAILWMWSGIMELSAEEQELAICKLKASLNPNGVLFIEVPSGEIKIIGTRIDAQKFKVEAPWGTLEAHLPLEEDMKRVAQNCKYKSLNTLKYETEKGLKRIIYALIC